MPPDLVKAHRNLDSAVDSCYRKEPFKTEMERLQFLFDLYRSYTAPLEKGMEGVKKGGRRNK